MSSCLKLVIRPNIVAHCQQKPIVFNIPRLVHTSPVVQLRKAPVGRGSPLGNLWTYLPWPSYFIRAWIRKKYRPEQFGETEEYRNSMFHRMSIFYALTAWTATGFALYLFFTEKENVEVKDQPLPYQSDLDKGGALYWVNALKSPDELQNVQGVKVVKVKGLSSYEVEDVTVKVKELGQERANRQYKLGSDFYLRKRLQIPTVEEGGPTNEEIRQKFKEEGKDYEIELDFSNQLYRVKTLYNPDGTVGEIIK